MLSTAILWLFAAVMSTSGQQPDVPVKHPDGAVPTQVARPSGGGNPVALWVAHAGYQPTILPGQLDSRTNPAVPRKEPLRFMELCYHAGGYYQTEKEGVYYLLVKIDDRNRIKEYVGWVKADHLVLQPQALFNPATNLHYKGLLVNTQASIRSKQDVRQLLIRNAPLDEAAGQDEPLRLYNILFVYGRADGYVLIGSEPNFNEALGEDDARRVVLGWVHGTRVSAWNTREAFEWDAPSTWPDARTRRQTTGRIYATPEDAFRALADSSVPPIFEEDLLSDASLKVGLDERFKPSGEFAADKGRVSPPLPHNAPRFPILQRAGSHIAGGELFKVGGIGGLYDAQGRQVISRKRLQELQDNIERVLKQVRTLEILFVIDDTRSMEPWFEVVAATVQDIVKQVQDNPRRPTVRIAVCYYNDITFDNKVPFKFNPANPKDGSDGRDGLVDLTTFKDRLTAELRQHTTRGGGEPLEMVFHGIMQGVERARFGTDARKIVMVLGDCGDKGNDPRHTEAAVVERLVADNQTPVEFYAVHVVDPKSEDDAHRTFARQMQKIKQLYGSKLKELYGDKLGEAERSAFVETFQSSDGKAVREQITRRYQVLERQALEFEQAIKKLQLGQWQTARITPAQAEVLERNGIPVKELQQIDGFQLYQEGYVWQKAPEGVNQVRERLFMNDRELESLTTLLGYLRRPDPDERPSVKMLLTEAIRKASGDPLFARAYGRLKIVNPSLDDLASAARGLSFQYGILKGRLDKDGGAGDDPLTLNEYFEVLKRLEMLEDVRLDQRHEYRPVKDDRGFGGKTVVRWVKSGKTQPAERGFHLPGDRALRWYYIDYREEMP